MKSTPPPYEPAMFPQDKTVAPQSHTSPRLQLGRMLQFCLEGVRGGRGRTGADRLAVLATVHAPALPACSAGRLAHVVGTALLVLPPAVTGDWGAWGGIRWLGDAGIYTTDNPVDTAIYSCVHVCNIEMRNQLLGCPICTSQDAFYCWSLAFATSGTFRWYR